MTAGRKHIVLSLKQLVGNIDWPINTAFATLCRCSRYKIAVSIVLENPQRHALSFPCFVLSVTIVISIEIESFLFVIILPL